MWELIGTTEIDLTNYYTKDDIEMNYLSTLGGGRVEAGNYAPISLENFNGDMCVTEFYGENGFLGAIGCNRDKPIYIDKDDEIKDILHTGNMAEHVITHTGGIVSGAISFQSVDNGYCGITKHHDETTDNGMLLQDTSKDGKITAIKLSAVNGKAIFHTDTSNAEEILHTGNIESFVGVNVPRTEVVLDSTNFSGGTVAYTIVNGICYVDISALSPIDLGGHKHVNLDALPTPATNIFTNSIYDIEVASNEPLNAFYMNKGYGVLICHVRHISATYCSFSYPIMTE